MAWQPITLAASWVAVLALACQPAAQERPAPVEGAARTPRSTVSCPGALEVRVLEPGASSSDVETMISAQLEGALESLEGLTRMESLSREGEARLRLEFSGTVPDPRAIRTRLERGLEDALPQSAEVSVVRIDTSRATPTTPIVIRGDASAAGVLTQLRDEGIDASIIGERARVLRVRPDPRRLAAHGLTSQGIRDALGEDPRVHPGSSASATDPLSGLGKLVVGRSADAEIRLGDVATIEVSVDSTPSVLDASGDVRIVGVRGQVPTDLSSRFPDEAQVLVRPPIVVPRCHRESLGGLASIVALHVPGGDVPGAIVRLTREMNAVDAGVLALVGVTEGLGLELGSDYANVHLLFPTATPSAVVRELQRQPGVEPIRVWGPASTRVAILASHSPPRDLALAALQRALEEEGFFALDPDVGTSEELSFSVGPRAAAFGLSAADIARQVRDGLSPEPLRFVELQGTSIPVVLETGAAARDVRALLDRQLRTRDGRSVPLSDVATVELSQAPEVRRRVDGRAARVLQTDAPEVVILAAWKGIAAEHPEVTVRVD